MFQTFLFFFSTLCYGKPGCLHCLCAYACWLFLPGNTEHLSCRLFVPSSLPLTIPQTLWSLLRFYCMTILEPPLIHFLKKILFLFFCVGGAASSSLCAGFSLLAASRLLWPWARGPGGCGAGASGSSGPGRVALVGMEQGLRAPLALGARPGWVWSRGLLVLQHVGSSGTGDQTWILCVSRQIPIHCVTRKSLWSIFLNK